MNNRVNANVLRKSIFLLVILFGLISLSLGSLTFAQTNILVTSPTDEAKKNDGVCTLREAVIAANKDKSSGGKGTECDAGSGDDVILLDPGVYTLNRSDNGNEDSSSTGDLDIDGNVIIRSSGPGLVVISGNGISDRVFHILPGSSLTLEGVTVRDGNASSYGGAIFNEGGTLALINSTLTGNYARTSGGALYNDNNGTSTLTNVTVTGNETQSGLASGLGNGTGTVTVKNILVSGDTCSTGLTPSGVNLAHNASGCESIANLSDDPLFDPLTVPTDPVDDPPLPDQDLLPVGTAVLFELQASSPAVNKIEEIDCPPPPTDQPAGQPTDQLGFFDRPQGGLCDIGAIELEFSYLVVTNNSDDKNVAGSLPWAIDHANLTPQLDTIIFAIDTASGICGDSIITLSSPLPDIEKAVIIDGTLKEDDSRCPDVHITIDGNEYNFSGSTILYSAEGSTIRDLNIRKFGQNGIVIQGDVSEPSGDGIGNTILGNTIQDNSGSGIVIGDFGAPSHDNLIEGNTISGNGGGNSLVTSPNGALLNDGITIPSGENNKIIENDLFDNAGQGVDLGADGRTENDSGDADPGANRFQNYPELYAVTLQGDVGGRLDTQPGFYMLQFFSSLTCEEDQPLSLIHEASIEVTTDGGGSPIIAEFVEQVAAGLEQGTGMRVTATDANGNTSELSDCIAAEENNVVWTQSIEVFPGNPAIKGFLSTAGEARWFFFKIKPGMEITIDLFGLPANYDLTVYKDIRKIYDELQTANGTDEFDLERAGAEFPSEMISSTSFTPGAYSPGAYSPGAYSPGAYSPGAYSPGAYSALGFTPGAYSEDVIAPGAYSPGAYSPGAYSPGAYSPGAYSPNEFLLGVDPALYASAQMSSLIAVSAFNNTASESVTINSFTNEGEYYVRVRGRNGVAVAAEPFWLQVAQSQTDCSNVNANVSGSGAIAYYGNTTDPQTVFVVDWTRLKAQFPGSGGQDTPGDELYQLNQKFKALADVYNGVIIEIGQPGSLIHARNLEAEKNNNYACPYAKNLVADEIKNVIDSYRFRPDDSPNTNMEYVVIAGGDNVAPFFRVPDEAMLGAESSFQPPVGIFTSSEASLRNNYVLTDDFYGAKFGVSYKDSSIPAIDLAVGRLVDSPANMLAQIGAFETLTDGVVNHDQNGARTDIKTFVTGYDFLVDAVEKIMDHLDDGTGVTPDTLVTPYGVEPAPGAAFVENGLVDSGGPWTGDHVLQRLANNDNDLIFFAGHFSASSLLSADFETGITTWDIRDLVQNGSDFSNTIVYSAGCHSGYNIVDQHSTPYTLNPDWAEVLAEVGGTLIGGTGYQYGDTQHLEYSERLYLYFTEELRAAGSDPISIGQAMVRAKQRYLADTAYMRGIHQKALIEATIFGLPMLAVDMPNRLNPQTDGSVVTALQLESQDPGAELGLRTASVNFNFAPNWTSNALHVVDLDNVESGSGSPSTITASWYSGDKGVVTNPGEPAVPLFGKNVSSPINGYTLRGVGFRGGAYADLGEIGSPAIDVYPVVGAATTEIRAINLSFLSSFWFPIRMWSVNLYDSLLAGGNTNLFVTPVQYMTDEAALTAGDIPPQSIMRRFNAMDFQLYYSAYTTDVNGNQPAQASPPDIAQVTSIINPAGTAVEVEALIVGNPGAGIQDAWLTYTGTDGSLHGFWAPEDLVQDPNDSRFWHGTFDITGTDAEDVRFIVQACGGNGRCSLVDNLGNYFKPGVATEAMLTATSEPVSNVAGNTQKVGEEVTFTTTLTQLDSGSGIEGKPVFFGLGPESRVAITGPNGIAEATFLLVSAPDTYDVTAWFPGDSLYAASTSPALLFHITQQSTALALSVSQGPLQVAAVLRDKSPNDLALAEQAVLFAVFEDSSTLCPAKDDDPGTAAAVLQTTAYTNPAGKATLSELDLPGGDYKVCAYFRANPSYAASTAQISLIINNPPVAFDDSYDVNIGQTLVISAPGVLDNDSDVDNDSLTAELLSPPTSPMFVTTLAGDGSFSYKLDGSPPANYEASFTYRACDPYGACTDPVTVTLKFNQPPRCNAVKVRTVVGDYESLWPPDKEEVAIYLSNASDPDGQPGEELAYFFKEILQDEKIKNPRKNAGAEIQEGCQDAWLLSDRNGNGNGRVYQIEFLVQDSDGAFCQGFVDMGTLPHDQSGDTGDFKDSPLESSGPNATCPMPLPPPPGP